ncbi:hypothetical protein C8J57DRAFT_1510963 [Mycena rebaudengoi]|nr:hypothetical protein C8J57DRAFT_1510963 [Mycena rebaudengoi]
MIILWQDKHKRSTRLLSTPLLTAPALAASVACAPQPRPSAYGPINVVHLRVLHGTPMRVKVSATVHSGSAVISARFDGASDAKRVAPGCAFHAGGPAESADVYFGAENCLYDSAGG